VLPADINWGAWAFFGSLTFIDLIAATTNALNGALLARRPDHYRNFTFIGILLMALLGGLGGGVTRDVILGVPPSAFTNPAYITLCLIAGTIGYFLAYRKGQIFREGLFQFFTSFSLPWYAIVGAMKATEAGYPILGAMAIAVIGPTAGRYLIDISSGVPPKQFVRSEWFVTTAAATGLLWILLDATGMPQWASIGIAFLVGFGFRMLALYRGWEEPLAPEPKGIVVHPDKRPLLGRKLAGKSQEELRMLGLAVNGDKSAGGATGS
jgi:uncharacterized membrane protein YeiH